MFRVASCFAASPFFVMILARAPLLRGFGLCRLMVLCFGWFACLLSRSGLGWPCLFGRFVCSSVRHLFCGTGARIALRWPLEAYLSFSICSHPLVHLLGLPAY